MSDWTKSKKDLENKELEKMTNQASKFLGGVLGDISKKSAGTQIFIGAVSGWVTGYTTMKVGKIAAFAIGGSIILVEVAHTQGYISIDWTKVSNKLDRVSDKVEEAVTGEAPSWMDKTERFIDRKIDRAEDLLKGQKKKAKKWYTKLIGDENGPKLNELHIFLTAFLGGVAIGVATA